MLLSLPSAAQVNTGDILGRVVDPTGAVIAGAKVTVTNPATGFSRETTTGPTGDFAVTLLPVDVYKVTIEATGFAKTVYEKVELSIGQKLTLEVSLKLAAGQQTVTVTEQPPLIEATRSEIGGSVSPTEVQELPVRDRNFASLMALVPGVRLAPNFDPTKTRSGNVTVNGSDGRALDYNVDGGDNKDNVIGGLVQNFTMEAIQEFNVVTDRYSAESGRAVGAVVNVVTKSGTNAFHGSLFSEFQVSTLNAKSEFDRSTAPGFKLFTGHDVELDKPVYHRYHFGGSFGGPIVKDKLFVFGAYEHKREPGKSVADPTALKNLALITTLNGQPFAAPSSVVPTDYRDHLLSVKMDHKISERQSWFVRYGRERWITPNDQPTGAGTPIADLSEATNNTNQFHSLVIAHNYVISSSKVNSFNFQFQDFVNAILAAPGRTFTVPVFGGGSATNPLISFPSAELGQNVNVPQQTLIRKYQFRDDFSWALGRHNQKFGVNYIYLAKLGGFFFFGANGYTVAFWDDPTTIFSNAAAYPDRLSTPGAIQEITFNTGSGRTDNQKRPHALAFYYQDDFKVKPHLTLNLGMRWDASINFLPAQLRDTPTTSNRTINILRQIVAANPTSPGTAAGLARAQGIVRNEDDLRKTTADWKEFQPRVGFAWDPTGRGKMVIRGGYGIARDQIFQNLTLFSLQQANETLYQTVIDQVDTGGGPTSGKPCSGPLCTFRFGMDGLPAPSGNASNIAVGAFGRINDPKITDPWAQQSSIGWSWQFSPDYAFSMDYYHVLGTHEPRVQNINPRISAICNPAFGGNPADPRCVRASVNPATGQLVDHGTRFFDAAFFAAGLGAGRLEQTNMIGTTNRSRYDGINFQLKKRMSRKFMFQTSYVLSWSKAWGGQPTASYSGNGIAIIPERQFLPEEFGPSRFDQRHRFVLSGVFNLPAGFELAPILQASSAAPLDFLAGRDVDGDGRKTIDRACEGSTLDHVITTPGCKQMRVNTLRGEPFFQIDLATAKSFKFGERASLRLFWEFYNLTNRFNKCSAFNNTAAPNAQGIPSISFLEPLSGPLSGP
jgi:hypothetical protein